MDMPQDFIEAINRATQDVNPQARVIVRGSITLGHEFDEWFGPEGIEKYGFGPLPPEALAAFAAKFAERREAIKAAVVTWAVDTERRRMAGKLIDDPPMSGRPKQTVNAVIGEARGSVGVDD